MGTRITRACKGAARAARKVRETITDAIFTIVFFVGAALIGAVVLWILTGEDDDAI